MSDELAFLSAAELAPLYRERKVSPVDVVDAFLRRIERWNDTLHAYITVCGPAAREEARRAEATFRRGDSVGPLHGVPLGVKDQFLTAGVRTTCGLRAWENVIPTTDATAVRRLREAGAIVLGKQNMPEAALVGTREWPYGQPRNPWDAGRDAGASSTGSGIALAAGLCTIALGEDTGGSIRGPAAFNGVVGMRPSWGRVSREGMVPLVWSLDTAGPMARSVRDCAFILTAMAGHDGSDVFTARTSVPDYAASLTGDVRGARVGVIRELMESSFLDAEIRVVVDEAAHQLERLGANVESVSLPLLEIAGVVFFIIADSGAANAHRDRLVDPQSDLDPGPRRRMLAASLLPVAQYLRVEQARNLIRDQIRAALDTYDVLLCPTSPFPPARIDDAQPVTWTREHLRTFYRRASHTSPFSMAGVPAISLPCGFTAAGLPVGLQLVAKPFDEATLLRVADAYERSTEWHTRRPSTVQ